MNQENCAAWNFLCTPRPLKLLSAHFPQSRVPTGPEEEPIPTSYPSHLPLIFKTRLHIHGNSATYTFLHGRRQHAPPKQKKKQKNCSLSHHKFYAQKPQEALNLLVTEEG
jgi:hypothetical protein